ncbi:SagB family peptide dehydrogenase [Streptomyces sp. H10-C2]|uniref:SagB family peptide dehydrogenase n=1 Tax=unclassified Streptomyces TaxID=2593676 RepID=UPI0024BB8779|nr:MULTISPECIES: SagB family peptide dehydrogenase [unclassified Streptomyces]MDJ0341795.1 SagB family peptide dehydrogenase [Streptomyces sp. PH10-H1]MDJ0370451.1 SagB family peptide dehydrogenase [Streptomyces sp. H10-C2]
MHSDPRPAVGTDLRRVSLWSLREDVHLERASAAGGAVLHSRWGDVIVAGPDELVYESLRRMSFGPVDLENILRATPRPHGEITATDRARLLSLLDSISYLVVRSLGLDDTEPQLLDMVPIARGARLDIQAVAPDQPLRLSRFAVLQTKDELLVLESALSLHRAQFHRPEAAWVIGVLGRTTTLKAATAALPVAAGVVADIVAYLAAAGMVTLGEHDENGVAVFPEDHDPSLMTWTPNELLFHTRTRLGRHDGDFGATFPYLGQLSPEPAVKSAPEGERIPLYRPDLEAVLAADPPLTAVLETRRSIATYAEQPLSDLQLGEFLYRIARIRSLYSSIGLEPASYPATSRPYPSGGSAYELECYITLSRCAGLAPGNYYYDPYGHCLVRLDDPCNSAGELLAHAGAAAGMTTTPQVLITITARFRRLSWKYSGMWYALALKHVGVVQQTMCLVATAMRLAPLPLGSGDIETSAQAFGLDWREESSIGELLLGPLAPDNGSAAAESSMGYPVNDNDWGDRCAATASHVHPVASSLPARPGAQHDDR